MKALSSVAWTLVLLCIAGVLPAGCDSGTDNPVDPGAGGGSGTRIVSLSPALTKMIFDLGGGALVVGVDDSHTQVMDQLELTTVGQYNKLNSEALVALKPTHVVALVGKEGAPAELEKLATSNGFKVIAYPYPTKVREVDAILRGRPTAADPGKETLAGEGSLAHLLDSDLKGQIIANEVNIQMVRVSKLADQVAPPGGKKPRVLLVFALEPRIQAIGPETVLHDVLTNYAGAFNAAIPELKPLSEKDQKDPQKVKEWFEAAAIDPATKVGAAPVLDREQLLDARPDVIVLLLPGAPPLDALDADPRLADLRGLDIPAVKNGRIVLINDKDALLPSTTLPKVTAALAKAIHPSLAEKIDKLTAPPVESSKDGPAKTPPPTPEPGPGTSDAVPPRTSAGADKR